MKLRENTEDDDSLKIANSMKRINELARQASDSSKSHIQLQKFRQNSQLDDKSPRNCGRKGRFKKGING